MADRKQGAKRARQPARAQTDDGAVADWAREWAKSLLGAVVLFLIIRTFLLQTYVITSGSMERTLLVGDLLTLSRAAYGAQVPLTPWRLPGYAQPRRGDVVVFWGPHEPDLELIKRLVGLPGDTLEMRDAVLLVNGRTVDEPYKSPRNPDADVYHPWMAWQQQYLAPSADAAGYRPTLQNWGPLVVPPGHYFMLGDNRDSSLDSRYWGFVARDKMKGRASLIYYSYDAQSGKFLPFLTAVRAGRIGRRIQ